MSYATLYRNLPPVVLASASPRRAQLLHEMGIAFEVFVPRIDERSIKAPSNVLARVLAEEKCLSVQNTHPSAANKLFVAADTIVLLDGKRLEKIFYGSWQDAVTRCTRELHFALTKR